MSLPCSHLLLIFTMFMLLPFGLFSSTFDLNSDRNALLLFRSSVSSSSSSPISKWNPSASPCSFIGIQCHNNRVTSLRLPFSKLFGSIPPGTVGNLTALRTLSLRFNALTSLPDDMSNLVELRALYLQHNSISQEIPTSISKMTNLIRLNLADNKFFGEVPVGLNNLRRLKSLYLERNVLVGQIPDLNFPSLVHFNVSYNSINGSIPKFLEKQPMNAFLGINNGICNGPFSPCKDDHGPRSKFVASAEHTKLTSRVIVGKVMEWVAALLILAMSLFLLCMMFLLCMNAILLRVQQCIIAQEANTSREISGSEWNDQ